MRSSLTLVLGFCLFLTGCSRAPSDAPTAAPIPATISHPVERDVTDHADFTARPAAVQQAKLDLEYTKVTAPVSGRASRYVVTRGNLIQSGQNGGTLLTTVVSVDPMYAYFDVDEHTVLRVRRLIREGKAKSARDGELPVRLGLANQEGFPHGGTVNFVDNQVNPKTGTLRLRGVFAN